MKVVEIDTRLEAIVERMLDKYKCSLFIPFFILDGGHIAYWFPSIGVFLMVDTNRLLAWQFNVEDWTSLKKQLQKATMFRQPYHIAVIYLIRLSIVENTGIG